MIRLALFWRVALAKKESEKRRSATEVETSVPEANEASVCIACHLDGPATEGERLGRRRDEGEARAVRHEEVARPCGTLPDAGR
jgi:hypothetical protein